VTGPGRGACTVCGGDLVAHFPEARDPLTGDVFEVARCVSCGLGHTAPQPEDLGRYYAQVYYGRRHGFTLRHCMKRRLGFVAAAVRARPGGRLLDIGCGDGAFLLAARESGWEVSGTELNPEPARSAGLEVAEGPEHFSGGPPFDCVTMWHTLEHMRDPRQALVQARTLLASGGRVVVAVPDWGGLQARVFGSHWFHLDVPRHLYHFDAGALECCLTAAGFGIERRWHQELEYDLLGWSQSALNLLMARPNAFHHCLTGKHRDLGTGEKLLACAIGTLLTVLSVPGLALGTLLGRGGTLIVAARPK